MAADPLNLGLLDFNQLLEQIARIEQMMADTYASAPPCKEKELLGQVIQSVKENRAKAQEMFPKAVAAIKENAARTQADLEKTRQEFAAAQAQLAQAMEQAKQLPQPPPRPVFPIDPGLGQKLRAELLDLFGDAKPHGDASPRIKEIWEDWDWSTGAKKG
jgi:DNA repair exonuclease SbcCD ATPase subunit